MRLTLITLLLTGVVGCDATQSSFEAARELAEQGDADAQAKLGHMYTTGEGVPQDYTEAMKWFRKAAEQGDAKSQGQVGWMYHVGHGVLADQAEAAKWFRKAAEQGLFNYQDHLGKAYFNGHGVPQDYVEAYAWYSVAYATGRWTSAKLGLNRAKAKLTPEQLATAEERAAELTEKINANKAK